MALACLLGSGLVFSQTIDFETLPGGGAPTDSMIISNQYLAAFGISFQFEDGSYPRIAKVGSPATAFYGPPSNSVPDTPAPGQNVGSYFLTDDGKIAVPPSPLIISYAVPVQAASGVLIDIESVPDGDEIWRIEARSEAGGVLESQTLTPASSGAGDGLAASWGFSRASEDIYSIRLLYTGGRPSNVGLAFDNFSPSTPFAPGPVSVQLQLYRIPGLTITGTVAAVYRIDYKPDLNASNWTEITKLLLPSSPYIFYDPTAANLPQRFYRVVGVP